MPRRRLGVVVLVDPPVATEIDGLRRAVGDRALPRIAPHITLVPPVNVPEDRLGDALARLRAAAAVSKGPLGLRLGPVTSFLPANPVLILEVLGELDRLRAVRDAAFAGPFERPLSWPWVPHVTLADELEPDRIAEATRVLDHFAATVEVDRVTVLEEVRTSDGRLWRPLADAALGPRRIVGRGGLPVELTGGRLFDPEGEAVLEAADVPQPSAAVGMVVTARREGVAVGVAWADGTSLTVVVHPDHRAQGVGAHLLAALETDLAAAQGAPVWQGRERGPRSLPYSKATEE